ncbi:MAG: glycosyltransferase [Ignavibacteriales bacterium]|nr:glycosyltransferase [Ignavibacteriales bacterium]
MKRVLFITYFWPPSGKASLHWPLYIIKHLSKSGWQPSVLTVDEDSFSHKDESLLADVPADLEVIKTAANEPFDLYRKFLGKKSDSPLIASETISLSNTGLRHRLAIWIRMNLFVPDARVGWYFSAMNGARRLLSQKKFDAIVSIGPPHSSHLIGKKLSREFNIPHTPVLIDPWVDIIYYKEFKRSAPTLSLDNYFERTTFDNAQSVVFVTQSAREEYIKKYPWIEKKSHVLYWGYNEENFVNLLHKPQTSNPETILHAGNIFDYQNPPGFWKNIKQEIDKGRALRLRFIGTVSPEIKNAIASAGLTEYTEYKGFLPYGEVIREMIDASYLLVCATEKRHVPGKLFEYLRTGNRIIAFGDDNKEVGEILEKANAGKIFPYKYDQYDILRQTDPSLILMPCHCEAFFCRSNLLLFSKNEIATSPR